MKYEFVSLEDATAKAKEYIEQMGPCDIIAIAVTREKRERFIITRVVIKDGNVAPRTNRG